MKLEQFAGSEWRQMDDRTQGIFVMLWDECYQAKLKATTLCFFAVVLQVIPIILLICGLVLLGLVFSVPCVALFASTIVGYMRQRRRFPAKWNSMVSTYRKLLCGAGEFGVA